MHKDNQIIDDEEDEITKCPYCLAKYHAKNLDCVSEKMSKSVYRSSVQSYQPQYIMPVSTQYISEIGKVKLNVGKINLMQTICISKSYFKRH